MKAVSYEGTRKIAVSERPNPKLKSSTDAILRVTTSGYAAVICTCMTAAQI